MTTVREEIKNLARQAADVAETCRKNLEGPNPDVALVLLSIYMMTPSINALKELDPEAEDLAMTLLRRAANLQVFVPN